MLIGCEYIMYFKDRNDTNIDEEFDDGNLFSKIVRFIYNYKKIFIIGLIVFIILVVGIIMVYNSNITNYLYLNGEDNMYIYIGSDYIEPGYVAYNSKKEDLSNEVKVVSNLNNDKVGVYEITYSIYDIVKKRIVTVVEKPKEYTYIYLKPVNNNVDIYLKKGDDYIEPGYQVFSSTGKTLTNEVKITGIVDTSKVGNYKLIYSVIDTSGITISVSRTVIVMDADVRLSLNNDNYTKDDVNIEILVVDNYFDYIILPNGNKVTDSSYSYKVSNNGVYKFMVYSKKGLMKEASIEVKNIDRKAPTGSCVLDYSTSGSSVTVSASDISGIKKYNYNGKDYTNNVINLSSYVDAASVTIYDNAGNSSIVSCKTAAVPTITNISNDGVIVTIKSKKVSSDIAGYYFSYTNKRPNKENGAYLATSNEILDVVRLPGTTYVWVEDKNGRISKPATIKLDNDILPITNSGYTILKGTKLRDYLNDKGWSLDEFNKLIARSVRAAGLYSKVGAATAAVSVEVVLIQKYNIKIPYWRGGKSNGFGADGAFGMYYKNPTFEGYNYYGWDCDGFVNWAYVNAGVLINSIFANSYYNWDGISYSKDNGEVGDVLRKTGHVALIVGKTSTGFIVAEASGEAVGVIINLYPYTNTNGYTIIKGERLFEKYEKKSNSECPSGF